MAQPSINPKIEELRFRLKTDPKSRLFYQLAEELRRAGQFAEAEGVLRNGLLVYPTYLAAWVSLGRVLREQKNDAGAVEALNKALQHDPGNVVAARLLADAYFALGEKVEAIKKYKLVQALLPTGDEELRAIVDQLDREISPPPPAPAAGTPADNVAAASDDAPFAEAIPDESPQPAAGVVDAPNADAPAAASSLFDDEPRATTTEPPVFTDEPPALAADDDAPLFGDEPLAVSSDDGRVADDEPATAAVQADTEEASPLEEASPVEEESPFDRTMPPFAAAEQSLGEEMRLETETADVEPMTREHDDSPFEDPVPGFTSASLEIEAPLGMQVVSAPLAADVPAYVDDELPTVDSTPVFDTTSAAAATESDDASNTITMADLYVRQGLVEEARHIYDNILARDPGNVEVRGKLDAIKPRVNPKVASLERWLAKVTRREVSRGI